MRQEDNSMREISLEKACEMINEGSLSKDPRDSRMAFTDDGRVFLEMTLKSTGAAMR